MRMSRQGPCSVEGCDRRIKARGLCETHYWSGDARVIERRAVGPQPCVTEACDGVAKAGTRCPACRAAKWRTANPEKTRAFNAAMRAQRKNAPKDGSADAKIVWLRSGPVVCHFCAGLMLDGAEHIDHLIPLAKGGSHTAANLVAAHASCNLAKSSKLWLLEWEPIVEDVVTCFSC